MISEQPLSGARIWIVGSVPATGSIDAKSKSILDFVYGLALQIFQAGGYIVHGSHPTLIPTLLKAAAAFSIENVGNDRRLILVVSKFFASQETPTAWDEWRKYAVVLEVPEVPEPSGNNRATSLELMRRWLAARTDAVVAVGGEIWENDPSQAGVPKELQLAFDRGLPCFVIGGLGGTIRSLLDETAAIFSHLRNGLDLNQNLNIAREESVAELVDLVLKQLARLPLVRGTESEGLSFRILALDGGGLKGAFTAAVLAAWEKHTGLRVVDHFDLIAGTSTGGILALGLAVGLSAQEVVDFYRTKGPVIFPVTSLGARFSYFFHHLFHPKYSHQTLLREVGNALNSKKRNPTMRDCQCRLIIPAFHVAEGVSHVFRTPHHPDLTADADTLAVHVAVATSAAPTYFNAAQIANMAVESRYFDGGVWANSPGLAAIVEAVAFMQVPMERLDILSVGTTDEPFDVRRGAHAGILGWAWRKLILRLLMSVQQESSLKLAENLVTPPRFLRINHHSHPGRYRLDGPNEIAELIDIGTNLAMRSSTLSQIKSRFLTGVKAVRWKQY